MSSKSRKGVGRCPPPCQNVQQTFAIILSICTSGRKKGEKCVQFLVAIKERERGNRTGIHLSSGQITSESIYAALVCV